MLLAVDTSTRVIGVALFDGIRVLSEFSWFSKNHHTIELAPTVKTALDSIGADETKLSAVGVAIGPGSFTGLRIGLALAKGLAMSRKIPIFGIPTFNILAKAQPISESSLVCVLEAGRRRFAVGWYLSKGKEWSPDGEIKNLTAESLIEEIHGPTRVCGELNEALISRLSDLDEMIILAPPSQSVRRPAVLAELAWDRFVDNEFDDPEMLKPIYLHHGTPIPE